MPAPPPLQVSDPQRIDPLVSQSLGDNPDDKFRSAVATSGNSPDDKIRSAVATSGNSPNDMFRSAVATSALERDSSPSEASYYESVDSFDPFKGHRQSERFNLQQHAGPTITSWNDGWTEPACDKAVGNFGIQLYNMGTRSDPNGKNDNAKKQLTRRLMDAHLKKSSAQINVCLECNLAVEELLSAPGERGADNPVRTAKHGVRLEDRRSWEHHVCALEYTKTHTDTLMIAARKRSFSKLEVLFGENMQEKPGQNTRLLVCKATLHRPVEFLGDEIIVCGVHGNHETMKKPNSPAYQNFYSLVEWVFKKFNPHFFIGDYNMGLLLVPYELSCRELHCEVLAYYPYRFIGRNGLDIGLDSCGIFYTREGDVECRLNWPASQIFKLLSAGRVNGIVKSEYNVELHTYKDQDLAPGQPWWRYKSHTEKLDGMLQDFLRTSMSQDAWHDQRADKSEKVEWLRFFQKPIPQNAVFVDGEFHKGAHMNLMVYTHNARKQRSQEAIEKTNKGRRERLRSQSNWRSGHQWSEDRWSGHQWSGHQW